MNEQFVAALAPYVLDNGYFNPYGLTQLADWPEIETDDGEEMCMEPLDLENWGIVEYTKNSLTISGGGDWQNPHTVVIIYNGGLQVESCEEGDYVDDNNMKQQVEAFFRGVNPADVHDLPPTIDELEYDMQRAIEREDYEEAARIRDEIKAR